MGISLDRSLRIRETLSTCVFNVYSTAIRCHHTHDQLLNARTELVFKHSDYKKAPNWVRSYLQGMEKVLMANIWNQHLVWMLSVDGELLTSKEVSLLTEKEKGMSLSKEPGYRDPWMRVDGDLSRHCWKDRQGNILRDKPFFYIPEKSR